MKHHNYIIFLPIFSAILLGVTRTTLPLDMLVFVSFVPLFLYFEMIEKAPLWNKEREGVGGGQPSSKSSFFHGVIFSTIYICIALHWINLVTIGGFLGILFLFGIVFGFLFWIVSFVYKSKTFFYPLGLIFAWICLEFFTNFTEFQFPWFNIGYGLKYKLPFLQVLEFGGMPFLDFLILVINYLFYLSFTRVRNTQPTAPRSKLPTLINLRIFSITISLLLIWYIIGSFRMQQVKKNSIKQDFKISLLQGNISQDIKWEEEMLFTTFEIYECLALQAVERDSSDLLVYPEAALPTYLLVDNKEYSRLIKFVIDIDTPIFTGFPHFVIEEKYKGQPTPTLDYNAANLFSPYPFKAENYYKNILVPFGERTPLLDKFPILWKIQLGQANFEPGKSSVIYEIKNYSFAPLICFEVAFPLFLRKTAEINDPDFWVNITNDAWFYRSIGTHQHAVMAAFRTIETRKQVFRAANTGYSFYTTPEGKIHDKSNLFERNFVTGDLYLYETITPYIMYGYLFIFIFIAFFTLQIIGVFIFGIKKIRLRNYKQR